MSKDYNIMARLSSGESSVPISQFNLDFPPGVLGSKLNCDIADVSLEIDPDASILFEIGIGIGSSLDWSTMMDVGKVGTLTNTISWLNDGTKLVAISGLANKWNYAPEIPIFLYDPSIIDPLTSGEASLGEVVDEDHNPIFPELIPKNNLDVQQLMNYIYVDKLGFTRVITNIPNFRLNFIQIPLTSSFHSAVLNEIGIFQPEYYNDDEGTLWIIDPQGTLPTGLVPRNVLLKHYANFDKTKQSGKPINAVILSYKDNFTIGPITSRVVQEVQEVGTPFTEGWQRTTISRFINDFHDNPRNTAEVTRSVVTRVLTQVMAEYDGLARLVSTEDQVDRFLYDFRLKTGYSKTLTKYFPVFSDGTAISRHVQTEENQIIWENITNTGEYIKRYEITSVQGSVVKTYDDPSDPETSTFRLQSFDQISKLNRNDLPSDSDSVIVENQPISTRIDTYRNVGKDQIEVGSQRINYILDPGRGASERSDTFQHTGTIQARATATSALQVHMIIARSPVGNEIRRVPVQLSAGNVPFDIAKSLAERILDRQSTQPVTVSMELSGLDLAMRRGSLRTVFDRAGNSYTVFITGINITGTNLGRPDFNVKMTAQGLVI